MIEFDEETHTYIKDGIILKSVTQILQELFPLKYENVPRWILDNKAEYGSEVHKYIEIININKSKRPIAYLKKYYNLNNIYQEESIKDYLNIVKDYNIKIIDCEKIVSYKYVYAGRYDIKAYVNGKKAIIDIKTTAELDKEYVAYQNSLYELADEPVEEIYCLWLPKGHLGKLIKLEKMDVKPLIESEIIKDDSVRSD